MTKERLKRSGVQSNLAYACRPFVPFFAVIMLAALGSVDSNPLYGQGADATAADAVAENDEAEAGDPVRDSVVKIYSIRRSYSLATPWKRLNSSTVSGSGVVISPTRVLTNYHVVSMTTDVSISLNGQSERISGTVLGSSPGMDLAVIELDEPLSGDITPMDIARTTPKAGSKIQVYGYPKGGQSLSITEGVVSRLEHVSYKYRCSGLRTQIDAPLNSGNSGGPMIQDGRVVGVAFSGLSSSNDIGYAIPCEEVRIFLDDLKDGNCDGKPQLWIRTETLASKELRKWLKMPVDASGIRFAGMPIPTDEYPLKLNDVITHIGEFDVNNLGKVSLDSSTQVSYRYASETSVRDGKVALKILRDGQPMDVEVPAFSDSHYLMDYMLTKPPTYLVYGPIVFGVANADFLTSLEAMLARGGTTARSGSALMAYMHVSENPYFMRRFDRVKDPDEELVIVSRLISNRMTRDARVSMPAVVRRINGQDVKSIRQAAKILTSLNDDQLVIEFDDNRGTVIVFDRKQIEREHNQIMEDNSIFKSASKDLRDVWDR